ncbi:MAG: hypothetical protein DI533_04575 [Cereibacter sphaeroides]|uniref:Uncharacterized protein n=1 Tax=Cereibacter sphaeroides TaxID=1063 RepID=A0A2W5SA60_CERSP|nr:MAG: hypothetical protein DI533_04575 [Cereibacter sphaeroides]
MKIYESDFGIVEKGWLSGFKFTIKATGRRLGATPFIKHHLAAVHYGLKSRGLDSFNDPKVKAAYWNYFLDLASSPPNGLHHQAIASMPIETAIKEVEEMSKYIQLTQY